MGNDSDYIDFWLTTSHDSHYNSFHPGSDAPNPNLLESKEKLKLHYTLGGSAILLTLTGYVLTISPIFTFPFCTWPFGDIFIFFVCHAISMLFYITMYKIESNIKSHVKFDRYKLSEQIYTCKTVVRFWSRISLMQFLLSIAPSIITIIIWNHPFEYRSIYDEATIWEWWVSINNASIPLSMVLAVFLPITNGVLALYYRNVYLNIDELISENETFIKANKDINIVDIGMLSEFFNINNSKAKLYFSNGCYLMVLNEPLNNKHGYMLFDKHGHKQEFIFEEQASSFADMLKNGPKIYENIVENINKALMKKNVEDITDHI